MRLEIGACALVLLAGCGRSDAFVGGAGGGGTSGASWTGHASSTADDTGAESGSSSGSTTIVGSSSVGSGADQPDACTGAEVLRITDVRLTPLDPPEWNPGEDLEIEVMVTAVGGDFVGDAGVQIKPDQSGMNPESSFIGSASVLSEGEGMPVTFRMRAETVPAGTLVQFTARVKVLDFSSNGAFLPCASLHVVEFEARVE